MTGCAAQKAHFTPHGWPTRKLATLNRLFHGNKQLREPVPARAVSLVSSEDPDITNDLVLQIDNEPRVRDGYISCGTRGHSRAQADSPDRPICRKNMAGHARRWTLVPPLNLHGKEGVDGSSPSEGF